MTMEVGRRSIFHLTVTDANQEINVNRVCTDATDRYGSSTPRIDRMGHRES